MPGESWGYLRACVQGEPQEVMNFAKPQEYTLDMKFLLAVSEQFLCLWRRIKGNLPTSLRAPHVVLYQYLEDASPQHN
jgi:hypothetical protein